MKHKLTFAFFIIAVIFVLSSESQAQWSSDRKISITDTTASLNENMGQCLAVNGDSVHAIWSDRKTDSMAIFYRHSYDAGSTWSAVQRLAGFSKSVDLPSIAVNGSTVHVTWRDNTTTVATSYYRRSLDGGNTWDDPVSLGNYYFWPNVTCNGSLVIAGFNDSHTGNSEVYIRRSTDNGTTWSDSVQISHALDRSEDQSIAASGNSVFMVWNDKRTGIMQTWYNRSTDNGVTWGREMQFTNTTGFAYFPIVHASGQYVDVAWGEHASGVNVFDVFYKTSSDYGVTWSAQQQLTHGTSSSAYPTIAREGKNVHLVWGTFGGDTYYEHSGDGGFTWDTLKSLVSLASNPFAPFIVVSPPMLHVIWIDKREGHPEVYYKNNPTGNPIANFIVPNSADLGTIKIKSGKDAVLMLRNLGTSKVNILKYSLFDPNKGFTLTDTSAHVVAAHDSAMIKIRFNPFTVNSYSGIITMTTDEAVTNSHQIMLTGKGVDGKLSVQNSIAYGDVKVGESMDTQIAVRNIGAAPIIITGYYLTDPSNAFVLLDTTTHQIAGNDSAFIKIRFNAAKVQTYAASLTITTDESGLSSHLISLSGRGVNSKLTVNPPSLNFGDVDSAFHTARSILISNTGTASVIIDSLVITGSSMFTLDAHILPDTLAAGKSVLISISFIPTAAGQVSATLIIGASEGTQPQVLLMGNGIGKKDTAQASVRETSSVIDLLEVTPNPVSSNAALQIRHAKQLEDVLINFYDVSGKFLRSQNIGRLDQGSQSISLELPNITGMSLLRITSGNELIGSIGIMIRR